ncbi:ABC transporter permease [Rhizobium mongolense]|uniref:ABC transporter permease n=1 Tax=Rhizobium mongolense TaxID=57676 RepID=UPI003558C3F8
MDWQFLFETFLSLMSAIPLSLELAATSIILGAILALALALCRLSAITALDWFARSYVFIVRGTPLLVQIFLIYYGLGQFPAVRHSLFWPFLREPYWCAVLALTMNTAAYGSEIIRGGLLSVPFGQIEAARACGMPRLMQFRRILLPLAIRQALPGYSNEMISMVKATSLASIITLMEVTGVAAKIISETYRAIEVFVVAGAIYLAINFLLTRLVHLLEYWLSPHLRQPVPHPQAGLSTAPIEGDAR